MISKYVREGKKYTKEELCSIFECSNDEEQIKKLIEKLRNNGILKKTSKKKDKALKFNSKNNDEYENSYKTCYELKFVGVLIINGCILKCYPKYLKKKKEPKKELRQVLKVIDKYKLSQKESHINEQLFYMDEDYNYNNEEDYDFLGLYLYLLQDYFDNGLYINDEKILEINGSGEIIWDRTISDSLVLLSLNRPYYVDLVTKRRVARDYDYITRLHKHILTEITNELQSSDLLDLFDLSGVQLSDESLEDFGDKEFILHCIENEMNVQFNTRKRQLLMAMYEYINKDSSISGTDIFIMHGSRYFYDVWEKACQAIIDNMLDIELGNLTLPKGKMTFKPKDNENKDELGPNNTLRDVIDKPFWSKANQTSKDTLKPDILSIAKDDEGWKFLILDAKYYTPKLKKDKKVSNQPRIGDITKQYLYQLAYRTFITEQGFDIIKNCFLLPTESESDKVIKKGKVSLKFLKEVKDLKLKNIHVLFLPARKVFDYYLAGEKINLNWLEL